MIEPGYQRKADLMLTLLNHVANENCFALKGGTAINFFIHDMPRISVDIDLTYILINDRETALQEISAALDRIANSIKKEIKSISITRIPADQGHDVKLNCQLRNVHVKIEVNLTTRGILSPVRMMKETPNVQAAFKKSAAINVVSHGELFGGKICAALDRQHPRDLFDVYYLFKNGEFNEEVKDGFMVFLLSHFRPIHELIQPHFLDHTETFESQFKGMTVDPFTYEVYENTRVELVDKVKSALTSNDKKLLVSFKKGEPDWTLSSLKGIDNLPAVQWKLHNIRLLLANPAKHQTMLTALQNALE
jgi:predicted nucleotidyltransferase component of viral defense system